MTTHYVYELHTADGTVLYVGVSRSVGTRISSHLSKPWGPEVARIVADAYPSLESGLEAERARIAHLQPVHNIEYLNPTRPFEGQQETRRRNQEERHARGEKCGTRAGCKKCRLERLARLKAQRQQYIEPRGSVGGAAQPKGR